MADLLAEILRRKREEVAELLQVRAEDSIRNNAHRVRENAEPHRLRKAMEAKNSKLKIIAEYKRRSPSKLGQAENLDHPHLVRHERHQDDPQQPVAFSIAASWSKTK